MKTISQIPDKEGRCQKSGDTRQSKYGLSIAYINKLKIMAAPAELYEEDWDGTTDIYRASLFVSGSKEFHDNPIPVILSTEDEQKLFDAYY